MGAGGAGMSAIAAVLAAMGHQTTGSDIKPSRVVGAPAHRRRAGRDRPPARERGRRRRRDDLDCGVGGQRRGGGGTPAQHPGPVAGRDPGCDRGVAPDDRRRRHPREDDDLVDARPRARRGRLAAELHHRGRRQRDRHERGLGRRRMAHRRSGRERRHLPAARRRSSRIVTSVESDHLEYYGSFEALEAAFSVFFRSCGSTIVCADDPVARSLAPASALTYGCAEGATMRIVGVESGRNDLRFELLHSGESIGVFALPVPGVHNARNAAAAVLAAVRLGRRPGARQAGAGALRRSLTALRVPRRDRRRHVRRRLCAPSGRGARRGRGRTRRRVRPGRRRLPAASLLPGGDAGGGLRRRVRGGRHRRDHLGLRGRRGATTRGVGQAGAGRRRARAPRDRAVYRASREDLVAYLRSVLQPGDICLTLAAGDLTNLAAELGAEPVP